MSKFTLTGFFLGYFTLVLYTLFVSYSEGQISFGGGGGSGGVSGWPTVSTTKVVTWANSLANALRIGDGTTPLCIYTDATLGPVIRPCTDSDTRTYIWTNFNWSLFDVEGNSNILTVDPDAATPNAMYTWASGYRPKKSIWFPASSLSVDGTNCASPAETTPLASGVKLYTIICTDNDGSRMQGNVQMPVSWDGGTVTMTAVVLQTAAETNVVEYQTGMECIGDTESTVTIANYGTEVVWTDTMSGSSKINTATSGAVTPAGGCAGGDFLAFYVDIGATNTTATMTTEHIIGFTLKYNTSSLSD